MIQTLRRSAYKNGYLLIVAAWLYTLSFIFTNYWSYTSSPGRAAHRLESYIVRNEKAIERFSTDAGLIQSLLNKKAGSQYLKWSASDQPALFVYTADDAGNWNLQFWNTNQVAPRPRELQLSDGKYFLDYPNGEFELVKNAFALNGRQVAILGLVPLRWDYFLKNRYLKTEFAGVASLADRYDMVGRDGDVNVRNGDGKALFMLKEKENRRRGLDPYSLTMRIVAVIFFLIFINVLAGEAAREHGPVKGFLLLAGTIAFIRFISYYLPIPFHYQHYELFDASVYASNSLHPSLGDLLINMILAFWLIQFVKLNAGRALQNVQPVVGRSAWLMTTLLCTVLMVMSFMAAGVIRSLIIDSQISFDIGNFFSLSIYTFISFLVLCFLMLAFFHLSQIIMLLLDKQVAVPGWGKYLVLTLLGLLYLTVTLPGSFVESNLFVLLWLLLLVLLLDWRPVDLQLPLIRSSFFLIWIIYFAASISALIIYQNRQKEMQVRKRRAMEIAMQTDPSGQNTLSIAMMGLTNAFLADNFERLQSPAGNKNIKDSIINESFLGYINRYDTRIYTFDRQLNSLHNEDPVGYEVLSNIIANRSKATPVPNLYYHENGIQSFSYIYQKQIKDYQGRVLGYFFVIANPKRYQQDALYPELFRQVKDDVAQSYAYAVYNNGRLSVNNGDYNFTSRLPRNFKIKGDFFEYNHDSFNELWFNAGNNKLVVVVKEGTVLFESITLFSYLFGSFLLVMVVFYVGALLLRSRFRWALMKKHFRFNIRDQIQTTILFITVFSFLVIGAATISFYIARFEANKREKLAKAIQIMAREIEQQVSAHTLADDVVKIYDEGARSQLERSIGEITEIHDVDINFYDLQGRLRVSTQPYVYNKQVLSQMMHPRAYYHLHYNHEIMVTQQEQVGRFHFLSIYVPVNDDDGRPYAYVNIPYLNSQNELKKEISNFLVTLINLNAFIFVLAGVIAVLLTNRITASFTLIGNKMQDINLGRENEEIVYHTNDEIGALVNEYNKMVRKLEESAQALAKSEREGAWREMARQVAHEIKNPLTPMKLSLQYLQRSIADGKPGIKELSARVAQTLVEQIDQLARIAGDFSQFANIENVRSEQFDVSDVLQALCHLHSANGDVTLIWNRPDEAAIIDADKAQVTRLFTNLIKNAIEASGNRRPARIVIGQQQANNEAVISISDEGAGIPEAMQQKIFTPNFTTKSSGTGLGLAISKSIVEKAGGRIWFQTQEGSGTTFYVAFPLAARPQQEQ